MIVAYFVLCVALAHKMANGVAWPGGGRDASEGGPLPRPHPHMSLGRFLSNLLMLFFIMWLPRRMHVDCGCQE